MPTITKRRGSEAGAGPPDYPYLLKLRDGRVLTIAIPGRWVEADGDGEPLFTPQAARFLDRIVVMHQRLDAASPPSPGTIATLRQALGLTQTQLGERVGVDKMTVYRWERGTLRPGPAARRRLEQLRRQAARKGVVISV